MLIWPYDASLGELFVTHSADREVIKMFSVANVSEVFWWERLNYDMLNRKGSCLVIQPITSDVRTVTNSCTQEFYRKTILGFTSDRFLETENPHHGLSNT